MTALAEILWSGPGAHSYDDFYNRLIHFQNRFDILGWTYAPGSFIVSIQADQKNLGTGFRINLTSEKPGEFIRFTTDGSGPSIDSPRFTKPFSINKTTTVKAALFINEKQAGKTTTKTFHFHKAVGKDIQYNISHKQKYPGAGPFTLVDGLTAIVRFAREGNQSANPAFDVTPHRLVTGIITDRGVCEADESSLLKLYPEQRSSAMT